MDRSPSPDTDVNEPAGEEVAVGGSVDEGSGLLSGQRSRCYCGIGDRGHAQSVEVGEGSARLDDVDLAVSTYVSESEVVDFRQQRAATR